MKKRYSTILAISLLFIVTNSYALVGSTSSHKEDSEITTEKSQKSNQSNKKKGQNLKTTNKKQSQSMGIFKLLIPKTKD